VNGRVISVPMSPEQNTKYSFHGSTDLTLTTSTWIAARYVAPVGNALSLAHTSPVYFWNGDQPIPIVQKDTEYLLARVESLIRETKAGRGEDGSDSTSNVFDDEGIRQTTLRYLEESKKTYQEILRR